MRKRKAERWIIIPDCHVPFEDSRAFNLVANIAKECKVDGLAILGDFLDLFSVSFHDKDPRRVSQLSDELNAANKRLTQLDKIGAKKKLFVEGNHEYRLTRYLINKAPALLETVSVPQMLSLKERGWKFTPYRKAARLGKLHLTHDVGYAGKFAHIKSGAAFEHSVVIGHSHQLAVHYFGNVLGESHVAAMLGWLGDASATDYMHEVKAKRDWHLGFGTAQIEPDGTAHLQAVPIIKYRACAFGQIFT
jgi:predicted phosphodiesterase